MARPLLYQPRQRWRIGAAFSAAALIHFAAIALASIHQHEQAGELPSGDDGFPPIELVTESPTDNPTPAPDVVDPPSTLNPTDESFSDEKPTPRQVRRQTNRFAAPLVKARNGNPGSLTLSSAKVLALSAPRPEYPYEARRQRITGDGIVVMTVDPVTGSVIDVSMWKSTGNPVLDNAVLAAFRRWRFKPGTVSTVKSPITFTMTGAQY
jgi:TonB family protein